MSADTPPPFLFDLWSTNGPVRGRLPEAEGGLDLREWTTWLRVRSDVPGFVAPTLAPEDDEITGFVPPAFEDDGLAVLVVARPQQDLAGRTIGLFHDRLNAEELEQLRRAIEDTPWPELPRPVGGHVTAPDLKLRYASGPKLIERGFNARSGNFLAAIRPLWTLIDKRMTRLRKQPAGTLEIELEIAGEGRERELSLGLRNRGLGPVAIHDPRQPRPDGGPPPLRVRVGRIDSPNPGVPPRTWTELPLPPPPADAPATILIKPRRRLSLRLPFAVAQPGAYLAEATWEDYAGPASPALGQTPFMPIAERGPSTLGSGPYPIRGAVFGRRRVEIPDDALP